MGRHAGATSEKAKDAAANKKLFNELATYADVMNTSLRGAGDGSVKYYLGGQLVAQNKEILDPWSVDFKGVLDK